MNEAQSLEPGIFRFQVSFCSDLNLESRFLQGWFARPAKQRQSWVRSLLVLGLIYRNNKIGYDCGDYSLNSSESDSHSINLSMKDTNPDDAACLSHLIDMPANRRPAWLRDTILWGFDTLQKMDQLVFGQVHALGQKDTTPKTIVGNENNKRKQVSNIPLTKNISATAKKMPKSSSGTTKSEKNRQNGLTKTNEAVEVNLAVVEPIVRSTSEATHTETNETIKTIEPVEINDGGIVLDTDETSKGDGYQEVGLDLDLSEIEGVAPLVQQQGSVEPPAKKALGMINGLFRLP